MALRVVRRRRAKRDLRLGLGRWRLETGLWSCHLPVGRIPTVLLESPGCINLSRVHH